MSKEFLAKKAYVDEEIDRLDIKADNIQSTLNVSIQALQDADTQFTKDIASVSQTATMAKSKADANAEEIKKKVNTTDLATVATSGLYSDLKDKPAIPTIDAEFSETSTNGIANKTVTNKINAIDDTIGGLSTSLQGAYDALEDKTDKTTTDSISQTTNAAIKKLQDADTQFTKDIASVRQTATMAKSKADANAEAIDTKANANHTHNYAGSSTAGGSATMANALTSKNIGSDTQPVYFNSTGTPSPVKYTLGDASTKTIKTLTTAGNTGWVGLATGQKYIPDMAFIAYWNGSNNDQGQSNLAYCKEGKFGTAATKGVDTTVTSGSANLVTSGGVSTALASYAASSHSHPAATTSAAGYMSAADKTKLDGIATGANKYSLPTASSTLGGVKTTSTVTSTSGLTACPIIGGVPYYKNTTYSSLKNPHAITLQGNGTTLTNGVYDGSAAKTVNITPTNIGACKATDGIVNNSFKVTKSSGATLTTTAAADKITISTDKKLFIGDDSGFASSTKIYGTFDHAQTVLYSSTSSSTLTSVSIANLFTEYSLIFINIQGSKTYHSHVVPLKYLKSKGSIIFKDAGSSAIVPLNLLYVSDTEMRWFEYQGQGTETYSSVQIIKIY